MGGFSHLKTFQICFMEYHNTFSSTLESFSPNADQNVFLSKLSSSLTSHSATMATSALPAHRYTPPSRFLSMICGLLILAGQMLWLAIQKPVPPTNDNNAWSKIQVITNLWSNEWGESTFPFFWYDEFLRFSWPMKFSDMGDLMIFFLFVCFDNHVDLFDDYG